MPFLVHKPLRLNPPPLFYIAGLGHGPGHRTPHNTETTQKIAKPSRLGTPDQWRASPERGAIHNMYAPPHPKWMIKKKN